MVVEEKKVVYSDRNVGIERDIASKQERIEELRGEINREKNLAAPVVVEKKEVIYSDRNAGFGGDPYNIGPRRGRK